MRKKEDIEKDLAQVDLQIAKLCFNSFSSEDEKNKYWNLKDQANDLREELRFLGYRKIATDEEIDIYENPVERGVKKYHITLHNVPKEIGSIKISYGATAIHRFGHIGYEIDEKYRGHNYTLRALEMLKDEMIEKGLLFPTIAAFPNNLPSIRIIENFGGKLIHEAQNRFDWNIYQVRLKEKTKELVKK